MRTFQMLETGQQIGRYKILSAIGTGGMGEVYLARDTKLERSVALKILPSDVASNEERMRRFEREAKSAAALNHPNIAHIYEIGETDGTHFISMEYIDGVTLNEKIHREKVSFGKLLKYLIQVAEGLAKAHAAGIVHRDLKPDNIMINRDDYAKILDFGLAKLVQPQEKEESRNEVSAESATAILEQHSTPGMIMGTAGYMSPEQALGKVNEIDHRSDIFSFGCILYEAATGRKAFEGKDPIDSMHKIIHAPTPQIRDANPNAPQDLQRIVRRCLAKEPDKRYQSIKDVAIELDDLRQELKDKSELEYSVQPNALSSQQTITPQQVNVETTQNNSGDVRVTESIHPVSSAEYIASEIKRHKFGWILALILLAVVASGAGYAIYRNFAPATTVAKKEGNISFQSAKFTRLTNTGKVIGVSISPDGKYVAHVTEDAGQQSLWIRQTATTSNVQIVPPTDSIYRGVAFSPDGNYVYYSVLEKDDRRGTLYQLPVLGGTPKKLLTGIANNLTFSPDGKQIAFFRTSLIEGAREDALIIANADGTGERTLAVKRDNERFHRGAFSRLSWSPDGKTIVCPVGHFVENYMTVAAVSVETGEVKNLTSQKWFSVRQTAWMSGGESILFNAQETSDAPYQIWQFFFATGEAKQITNDLISYRQFSLTPASDALAVIHGEGIANIWAMPVGNTSRATQITSDRSFNADLTWTPNGKIIYASDATNGLNLYLTDSGGSNPKQLSDVSGANRYPTVTRDGRYIVFMSDRSTGRPHIWRMDIDGGNQKQLTGGFDLFPNVSPDGRWIIYQSWVGKSTLRKVSIEGGQPVQVTDYISGRPAISPDGKQIACAYQETLGAPQKLAILAPEGGAPLKIIPSPIDAEINIRWTTDGREIVYSNTDKGVSNLWAQPIDGGKPRQLTNFTADRIFSFDFSQDGKQLSLSRGLIIGDVVLIKDFR